MDLIFTAGRQRVAVEMQEMCQGTTVQLSSERTVVIQEGVTRWLIADKIMSQLLIRDVRQMNELTKKCLIFNITSSEFFTSQVTDAAQRREATWKPQHTFGRIIILAG